MILLRDTLFMKFWGMEMNRKNKDYKINIKYTCDENDPDFEKLLETSEKTKKPIILTGDRLLKVTVTDKNGKKDVMTNPSDFVLYPVDCYLNLVIGEEKFLNDSFYREFLDDDKKVIFKNVKNLSKLPFSINLTFYDDNRFKFDFSMSPKSNRIFDIKNYLKYCDKISKNGLKISLFSNDVTLLELKTDNDKNLLERFNVNEKFLIFIYNVEQIYQILKINSDIHSLDKINKEDIKDAEEILEILSTKKLKSENIHINCTCNYKKSDEKEIESYLTKFDEETEICIKGKSSYTFLGNEIDLGYFNVKLSPAELINKKEVRIQHENNIRNKRNEDLELDLKIKQKNSNCIVHDFSESDSLKKYFS